MSFHRTNLILKSNQMLADIQHAEFALHVLDVLKRNGDQNSIHQIFQTSGISLESVGGEYSMESISGFFKKIAGLFKTDYGKALKQAEQYLANQWKLEIAESREYVKKFHVFLEEEIVRWSQPGLNDLIVQSGGRKIFGSEYAAIQFANIPSVIKQASELPRDIDKYLAANRPGPGWRYTELDENVWSKIGDQGETLFYELYSLDDSRLSATGIKNAESVVSLLKSMRNVKIDFGQCAAKIIARANEIFKALPRDESSSDGLKQAYALVREVIQFTTVPMSPISGAEYYIYDTTEHGILGGIHNVYKTLRQKEK